MSEQEKVTAYAHTATAIQRQRELKGWSQAELSRAMKVSRQAISNWERGHHQPRPSQIQELARLFGVDQGVLLAPARSTDRDRVAITHFAESDNFRGKNKVINGGRANLVYDERHPRDVQVVCEVRDDHAVPVAQQGAQVLMLDLRTAGINPQAGQLVLLERDRGDIVEHTLVRLVTDGNAAAIQPLNQDKPSELDSSDRIIGVAISILNFV